MARRVAVVLFNLGGPDAPESVRPFLVNLFSDPAILRVPGFVRPWLAKLIAWRRTKPAQENYAVLGGKSPLRELTEEQGRSLEAVLRARDPGTEWRSFVAMRYWHPMSDEAVSAVQSWGADEVLLVPLYPQYAAATTATAADQAFRALMKMRWQPAVRVAPAWHDDPAYIAALAASMRENLAKLAFQPEKIVATFHGMPEKYLLQGDPYHCHCVKTSRLLREALGLPKEQWVTSFQSRFGNDPWLKPYTDETVAALAKSGVKRIAMVAPGFSADCLETLEELNVENREIFMHNGGEQFAYLPALNDSEHGIDVIEAVVRRELMGWV
jgi:ferrochelatase